jgi:ABC-type polysaccharide/polyol phosphate transport system ATPase subunit
LAKIELDNVNVVYPVGREKGSTFKEFVIGLFGGKLKRRIDSVHALRDVCMSLGDGTRMGIVGHNGAGKSTLLRTMAGVYPLSSGRCDVQGRICSLFDITLGFEREATGWDNIRYRSFLQGESPASLRDQIESIADFCELGDFLDLPIKCYSAGMIMRLAFAVATARPPEILLIDEVFGTGDLAFRAKAKERMTEMIDTASIIVMVGHDLAAIQSFCTSAAWMEQGRVRSIGSVFDVLAAYQRSACLHPSAELVARHRGPGDSNAYVGRLVNQAGDLRAQILKNISGCWHLLAWAPVRQPAGRLRFDAIGPSLRLYLDNQLVTECEDYQLKAGSVGLRAEKAGGRFERFAARAILHDDRPGIHPLGGDLLTGSWVAHSGAFRQELDRWKVDPAGVALSTLVGIDVADVSVACDVDLTLHAQRLAA